MDFDLDTFKKNFKEQYELNVPKERHGKIDMEELIPMLWAIFPSTRDLEPYDDSELLQAVAESYPDGEVVESDTGELPPLDNREAMYDHFMDLWHDLCTEPIDRQFTGELKPEWLDLLRTVH